MSDREIVFTGGWVETNDASIRLRRKGYTASGFMDKGVPRYAIHHWNKDGKYELVHEFSSAEELNNVVKLLIEEGD